MHRRTGGSPVVSCPTTGNSSPRYYHFVFGQHALIDEENAPSGHR